MIGDEFYRVVATAPDHVFPIPFTYRDDHGKYFYGWRFKAEPIKNEGRHKEVYQLLQRRLISFLVLDPTLVERIE